MKYAIHWHNRRESELTLLDIVAEAMRLGVILAFAGWFVFNLFPMS